MYVPTCVEITVRGGFKDSSSSRNKTDAFINSETACITQGMPARQRIQSMPSGFSAAYSS